MCFWNEIIQYVFYDCLFFLLNVLFFKFIHVVEWILFHWMNILQFVYLFFVCGIFWVVCSFYLLRIKMLSVSVFLNKHFCESSVSWWRRCMFNCMKNCQMFSQNGSTILYSYWECFSCFTSLPLFGVVDPLILAIFWLWNGILLWA